MDFDSFITYILILLFFVGPTILKQWQKKQKKKNSTTSKQSKPDQVQSDLKQSGSQKPGLFGKIQGLIQQFVKELEAQALEAKRKAAQDQDQTRHGVWDELRDPEEPGDPDEQDADFPEDQYTQDPYPDNIDEDEFDEVELPYYQAIETEDISDSTSKSLDAEPISDPIKETGKVAVQPRQFKSNQLQNAIVWSEILSKPMALRNET